MSTATLLFRHSVVSDSLRPYELQHARPPCPNVSSAEISTPTSPTFPLTPELIRHRGLEFLEQVHRLGQGLTRGSDDSRGVPLGLAL